MKYAILDKTGAVQEQGDGELALDEENATLQPKQGRPLTVRLSDIDLVDASDYKLTLTLYTGDVLRLSHFGAVYEQTVEKLSEFRYETLMYDLAMGREEEIDSFKAVVNSKPARVFVLRDQVSILGNTFDPFTIPFADLEEVTVNKDAYSVELRDDEERSIFIHKLGPRFEEFERRLDEAMVALDLRTRRVIEDLVPGLDPIQSRRLTRLFKDGRAVKESDIRDISDDLWSRLEQVVVSRRALRESYDALRAMGRAGETWLGIKELREGEEEEATSEPETEAEAEPEETLAETETEMAISDEVKFPYVFWFFVAMDKTVAHEVVSEKGHATYLYRIGEERDRDIRRLNRAIRQLSFKREPIYATREEIERGRLTRYRVALRKLPYLRQAREAFLGRAIHASPESWKRQIDEALRKA